MPETDTRKIDRCLKSLKLNSGYKISDEVKLKNIDESIYLNFLKELSCLNGVVFCTATDAGLNGNVAVKEHQKQQAKLMLKHIDKMKYESGRNAIKYLTSQIENLSPQLYVQLCCQVDLMFEVVNRSIPYFIQRKPNALKKFRWRADRKNIQKIDFEDAFEKISPALLQTMSISEPLMMIRGYDYRCLKEYMYEEGRVPEYLKEVYGINVKEGLNIQKLIRGDIQFVDSKNLTGVQVTDLIVSGIRRCLRKEFLHSEKVAHFLGRMMIQAKRNKPPINLVSYSGKSTPLDKDTAKLIKIMIANCRPMIHKI